MKEERKKEEKILEQVKNRIREMYIISATAIIDGKNPYENKIRANTLEYVVKEIRRIEGEMNEDRNI